jgi:PIN domain nuclease of toxin-antitoxin system
VARVLQRVVVDAGPIVSVLLDDPAAPVVAELLQGRECSVSVVNVGEVLDVLIRVHRVSPDDAAESVDRYLDEVARPIPATRGLAMEAALIRARHYRRRGRDVSLADCFAIATALPDSDVATSDSAVARVADAEGLGVIGLPNARGRRP